MLHSARSSLFLGSGLYSHALHFWLDPVPKILYCLLLAEYEDSKGFQSIYLHFFCGQWSAVELKSNGVNRLTLNLDS
jgi:hypothetical protein